MHDPVGIDEPDGRPGPARWCDHETGTKPSKAQNAQSPPPAGSQPTSPQSTADGNFERTLANTVINNATDPDDHVRCFFTLKQLMDLRPSPGVAKLTEADQSRVLTEVIGAVSTASNKDLTERQKGLFVDLLLNKVDGSLVGKTPGEALATIMSALYSITNPVASMNAGSFCNSLSSTLELYGANPSEQEIARNQEKDWCKSNQTDTLSALASVFDKSNPDLAKNLGANSVGSGIALLNETVANSARNTLNKLTPPADIGCAYQVLSWKEANLLFGRSVANDFIAVQVTVRNLNAKEEFIVHNAMLAVDTDINGGIGRYFEGMDKIGVEAYNKAGEPLTARGIVGNSIAAASVALSVIQPMVNATNFSNAVAAVSGGVVPGWQKLSPDSQKEQLLLIANNGFTATYNTKTVVGKSGAATFYTWFPAKPFLQGWWVQGCARNVMSARIGAQEPAKGSDTPPQLGVDPKAARDACGGTPAADWRTVHFKDWSPIADELFRELSLAVVAGIHVLEENKQKSLIADIQCPNDTQGNIDLSKASSRWDHRLQCDGRQFGQSKEAPTGERGQCGRSCASGSHRQRQRRQHDRKGRVQGL